MAEKEIAVKVDHLTKSFRIPLESSNGIKQKLIKKIGKEIQQLYYCISF